MGKLLGSAASKDELQKLINEKYFFGSKCYVITEYNRLYNSRREQFFDEYTIKDKNGRWRFERAD